MIKKMLFRTFACFTVLTSAFALIMMLGNGADSGLSALRTFLFLPFSILFGIADTLLINGKINRPGALAIHALLMIPGTYLCIFLPVDVENEAIGSARFLHFCLVAVVYAAVMFFALLFTGRVRKTLEEDKKYRG